MEGLHDSQGFGAKFGLKSLFGAVTERDINSWRSKKIAFYRASADIDVPKSEESGPRK